MTWIKRMLEYFQPITPQPVLRNPSSYPVNTQRLKARKSR